MNATLEALVREQRALLLALERDDVNGIARHSEGLGALVFELRDAAPHGPADRPLAEEAVRLADAARARVNLLADMTERRMVRLAAATGKGSSAPTYGRDARLKR